MKTQQYVALALLFCILTISLGCGKKGPPKPPEEILNINPLFK